MFPMRPVLALFTTLLLGAQEGTPLKLPATPSGGATLFQALQGRRTERSLGGPGLTLAEAAQLLWAAQGENRPGKRTVPSAHAKYPLELYLLTSGSDTLAAGAYHYHSDGHSLGPVGTAGPGPLLAGLKGMQAWIAKAPAVFVVAGAPARMAAADPAVGQCLTYYEAGAAAQSLLLQAAALGLDAGTAAGIDLPAVAQALKLPAGLQVLMVLPVGRKQ
jgi:SagB-type dehydrogenase family enzyme